MQVPLPVRDVSLGGGRGYPEGCTCGVDGDPSHEQELPLITLVPQYPYQRLAQMKHFPYLPSRADRSTGALQHISQGYSKSQGKKRLILTILLKHVKLCWSFKTLQYVHVCTAAFFKPLDCSGISR